MTPPRRWRLLLAAGLLVLSSAACTLPAVPAAGDGGARKVDPGAVASAACRQVDPGDLRNRTHLDPATAPPASELYGTDLPAAGPHFGAWSPIIESLPSVPLDPRSLLHNLEHGAVVVWLDPESLDAATLELAARWRDQLGAGGFDNTETGATVFVSRFPDHVESDAGVALRAWGVAVDCKGWDLAAVDAFVWQHYGTRGNAPEAGLGPWPSDNGVLVGPPEPGDDAITTV